MTPEEAARVREAAVRRLLWGVQNGDGVEVPEGGVLTYQEAVDVVREALGQAAAARIIKA